MNLYCKYEPHDLTESYRSVITGQNVKGNGSDIMEYNKKVETDYMIDRAILLINSSNVCVRVRACVLRARI